MARTIVPLGARLQHYNKRNNEHKKMEGVKRTAFWDVLLCSPVYFLSALEESCICDRNICIDDILMQLKLKPLIPEPSTLEVEIASAKLKRYYRQVLIKFQRN
jgi:hypothetical protein